LVIIAVFHIMQLVVKISRFVCVEKYLLKDASLINEYLSFFQKLCPEYVMTKQKFGEGDQV